MEPLTMRRLSSHSPLLPHLPRQPLLYAIFNHELSRNGAQGDGGNSAATVRRLLGEMGGTQPQRLGGPRA